MNPYTAHITPSDGIPRRVALIAFDMGDAQRQTRLLALQRFGRGFTYSVRPA